MANGCIYCHSGYTRPQDVRTGLMYLYPRISMPGDFVSDDSSPNVFGTARIGPDLSQESGFHPDDWERAHFADPRFVEPMSIMPSFSFLTDKQVDDLSTYLQLRAGKNGLVRYAGQIYAKKIQLVSQGVAGPTSSGSRRPSSPSTTRWPSATNATPPDGQVFGLDWPAPLNIWLVDRSYWLADNPLPVTTDNLLQGRLIFQQRCIGCHGEKGDAVSEAAKFLRPQPIDFTSTDDASGGDDTSPGMLYYRVLRGIEGSGMENFGSRLRVDDIWRVVLFLKTIPNGGSGQGQGAHPRYVHPVAPVGGHARPREGHAHRGQQELRRRRRRPTDPWMLEARRVLAGLNDTDKFDLPATARSLSPRPARTSRPSTTSCSNQGWNDYFARGGSPSPPPAQKDIPPDLTLDLR